MFLFGILSLVWVIMPDFIPGFLDDILILASVTVPMLRKSLKSG